MQAIPGELEGESGLQETGVTLSSEEGALGGVVLDQPRTLYFSAAGLQARLTMGAAHTRLDRVPEGREAAIVWIYIYLCIYLFANQRLLQCRSRRVLPREGVCSNTPLGSQSN